MVHVHRESAGPDVDAHTLRYAALVFSLSAQWRDEGLLYGFAFIGPTPNGPFYKRYYFFFGTIIDQPRHYFVTARSGPTVSGPISAAGRLRPPSLPPAPFSGATTSVTTLAGSSEGSSSCRV